MKHSYYTFEKLLFLYFFITQIALTVVKDLWVVDRSIIYMIIPDNKNILIVAIVERAVYLVQSNI